MLMHMLIDKSCVGIHHSDYRGKLSEIENREIWLIALSESRDIGLSIIGL
jgi:hypothetical protein